MSFWSPIEVRTLFRAVAQAPSVHNSQPWVMELHERSVLLFERWDVALPHHEPKGRDRLLSCGAALTNLRLAMRVMGWQVSTLLLPDPAQPDLVATVTAVRRQPPTETEADWYAAIPERRSHRYRFDDKPLTPHEIDAVEAALVGERVSSRRLAADEAGMVAGLMEHTAELLHHDHRYQRELRSWTVRRGRDRAGIPVDQLTHGLFGGLVRLGDGVPDHEVLTARIADECVLVVETVDDGRRDHLIAGAAIERAWLAATHLGLAVSVITQPLQLAEVRAGLSERLHLPGFPHALLRVGRPSLSVAASPRRSFSDLVRTL
ncbi:Acg family FMN-binding oxidoreductase [Actinocrispum wychmicini]|uniref:Nitroreductase family protein n=1 Tax=Actinocrispum wychmicini TaxID=1213861 RepID=A0A4R2JP93_9PSEU|nr:nitroreductase family protein [Actinocrispum wychmicini]TCO61971.1 nitroreductase family protein [Actinocrispum wychmicini]